MPQKGGSNGLQGGFIVSMSEPFAKKERAIVLSFLVRRKGLSYIRLAASYIGYASYICFASDIGLRPALEANII